MPVDKANLQAQIAAIDLQLKEVNAKLKDVRVDIEFPHINTKRLASVEAQAAVLCEQLSVLAQEKEFLLHRLSKEGCEAELQQLYAVKDNLTKERLKLTTALNTALVEESVEKLVNPTKVSDLKSLEKLMLQFPREELERILAGMVASK